MFMWGPAPIRRTIQYLKAGKFIAKDQLRIMEVHYHLHGRKYQSREEMRKDCFHGMREFYFWEMPRIQYQNPQLQIVRILDKMPSPYIRFWFHDGNDLLLDCFGQSHNEILSRVIETAGKSEARLKLESSIRKDIEGEDNPAMFGHGRERFCMCEVPGQSPCPGYIRNPRFNQIEVNIGGKVI